VIPRFPSSALFFALAATLPVSCQTGTPPEQTPVVSAPTTEPQSKPVKMPPTIRKLGASESIDVEELFAIQQSGKALIYDVRHPYFHAIDHIPGSINWPHTEYDAQVQLRDIEIQKALADGKKVVVYCFNLLCPEARNVAKKLARRDYVIHVFGSGIDTWRTAGLPLEGSAPAKPE
jgi:rhodanese-related sulfurtransferase